MSIQKRSTQSRQLQRLNAGPTHCAGIIKEPKENGKRISLVASEVLVEDPRCQRKSKKIADRLHEPGQSL
jgi:hypothetical protein